MQLSGIYLLSVGSPFFGKWPLTQFITFLFPLLDWVKCDSMHLPRRVGSVPDQPMRISCTPIPAHDWFRLEHVTSNGPI